MQKISVIILLAGILAGCATVRKVEADIEKPCGVIVDSLKDVRATTRAGEERISSHFERGVSAGCWPR